MASIGIQSIHCYSFNLPLAHPFFARQQEVKNRQGLIVHVISDYGEMGFGEIAPLPGVSPELLKKALHQAEVLARELKDSQAPIEAHFLLEWLASRLPETLFCASVRFGFESAIINMMANFHGQSVRAFLRPGGDREVCSAGLLQGTPADVVRQARFLTSKGYMTFKLRVGSRNIPIDVQKVQDVRRVIPPDAKIRLDANRAWRLDEAIVFAQNIGKDRIEYIEEPVADQMQIEDFARRTDMPVAMDETLQEKSIEEWAGRVGVAYAVARPMTMGVIGYLKFLDMAAPLGIHVIVSSAFESGIGMTMLANLAALTYPVANLGTANWFDQDLLLRPVVVEGGRVPSDRMILETKFFHDVFSGKLKVV
jgi:o-succinylbenzoate synthase